jgi:hypothetical protein
VIGSSHASNGRRGARLRVTAGLYGSGPSEPVPWGTPRGSTERSAPHKAWSTEHEAEMRQAAPPWSRFVPERSEPCCVLPKGCVLGVDAIAKRAAAAGILSAAATV